MKDAEKRMTKDGRDMDIIAGNCEQNGRGYEGWMYVSGLVCILIVHFVPEWTRAKGISPNLSLGSVRGFKFFTSPPRVSECPVP
jgi:hypothetical protein